MRTLLHRLIASSLLTLLLGALALLAFPFPSVLAQAANAAPSYLHSLQAFSSYGEANCVQIPTSVNLSTLTDAELALYGLPSRAEINANPQLWASKLTHIKHRYCGGTPYARQTTPLSSGSSSNAISTASTPSTVSPATIRRTALNWAGNVAYGPRGTYRITSVIFPIPTYLSGPSNAHAAFWTGVGGDCDYTNSFGLIQAGIDLHLSALIATAWYQILVGSCGGTITYSIPPVSLSLGTIYLGDSMTIYVSSNFDNDGYNYFEFEDYTTGAFNSHFDYSGHFSDSASGDFIVERPLTSSGQFTPLLDFQTAEFLDCYVYDNYASLKAVGDWPHDYYVMVNSAGRVLVSIGPLNYYGDTYTMTWLASS